MKVIEPCRKCGNAVEYERVNNAKEFTLGPPLCADCRSTVITNIEYKTVILPVKPKQLPPADLDDNVYYDFDDELYIGSDNHNW